MSQDDARVLQPGKQSETLSQKRKKEFSLIAMEMGSIIQKQTAAKKLLQ